MISPFHSIIKSEEDDFEDHLTKLHLISIFKPLLEDFGEDGLFKKVVKFILLGYSMESDMLMTVGNTWGKVSEEIYDLCELPDDRGEKEGVHIRVCKLENDSVRETIERWIQFQNNDAWAQYVHFRDVRKQFLELSISDMKKNTGEIDIEAKMKAVVYSRDLLKMMEDAREGFIQNHPKLRGSVEALNKVNNNKNSRSPGTYAVR